MHRGKSGEQLLEDHLPLNAGESSAYAEMYPVTEREMWFAISSDIEYVGVLENRFVAIGWAHQYHEAIALADRASAYFCVINRHSLEPLGWGLPRKDLPDCPRGET